MLFVDSPAHPHGDKHVEFVAENEVGGVHGQLDIPDEAPKSVVILVPGSGSHNRDMVVGPVGLEGSALFYEISRSLTSLGIAVIRYDERDSACAVQRAVTKQLCSAKLVASVTPESRVRDYVAAAKRGIALLKESKPCVIALAVSEGMLQVAKAVESRTFIPDAVVGIGAIMESPMAAMRWQLVQRVLDEHDRVSKFELRNRINSRNRSAISKIANYNYDSIKAKALSEIDDIAVLPLGEKVSARWWRQWFVDDISVSYRLNNYKKPISLFYGENDFRLLPQRQTFYAKALIAKPLSIKILKGRGHFLGADRSAGPMSVDGLNIISEEALTLSRSC